VAPLQPLDAIFWYAAMSLRRCQGILRFCSEHFVVSE
jgi:hypothetical protein